LECDLARRYQNTRDILNDLENQRSPEIAGRAKKPAQVTLTVPASRQTWVIGGTVAAVLIAGTLAIPSVRHALFGNNAATQEQAQPALKSMAILPLRVIGDSSQDMIAADGVVDTLSAKLFQLKDVHLASPNDVARLKTGMSPQEIGKVLGVTLLVQGTYQAEGDRFRLILTLDDVKAGKRVWTSPFEGRVGDIFTIEDDVYNKLLNALNLHIGTDEQARTGGHATYKIAAYEAYLRGRNAMRGNLDAAAAQSALGYYQRALKEDPDFALAYAGIADANLRMYKETKDPEWSNKAVAAAEQAQVKGPNVPEVHFVLSSAYQATGKSIEAIAEINRALQLAPNSDEGYRRLGDALRSSDENGAIAAYKKATEINPYYWYNYNALGTACFRFGNKDDQAIAAFKKATEVAPNIPLPYANLGAVYLRAGKNDDAIPQFQAALKLDPNLTIALGGLANAYFQNKRYADAAQMFEKQVAQSPNDETAVGNLADAYRWAGDKQKADAMYDRAIALAQKALQVNPRDADSMSSLALYYAKKGDPVTAQQYIRRARAVNSENKDLIYYQGIVEALAGNDDQAIKTLAEAFNKGYPVDQAETDPELSKLKSRPDFAALLKAPSNK
jgi:tetratricopeptide (TPR) repeat protein